MNDQPSQARLELQAARAAALNESEWRRNNPPGATKPAKMSEFQAHVRDEVRKLPAGTVATYDQIAARIGSSSARAVGQALARHLDCPWWRVVNADGSLPTTALGERQAELLAAEGVTATDGRVPVTVLG